jgi:glycosyltransferase involved in cell wall biosynthesis
MHSPRRPTILQLCKFFPPDWGGMETVAYNLMLELGSLGVENGAIAIGPQDRVDHLENSRVTSTIHRVRGRMVFERAPVSLGYFLRFRRIMRDYQAVVAHMPNPLAALCILLSGYRGRVILYWHADVVGKGLAGQILWPLERLLIRRADAVIAATSVHLSANRHARAWHAKAHVVPYPIAPQLMETAGRRRARPQSGADPVKLLAIGRLVPYKGLDVLIRCLADVGRDCRLDILGEGPLQGELQALIDSLGLSQKVTLHGGVPEDARDRFLDAADIFCLPSITRAEMFGMVQLEAMAHGVPVITTDIPGSGTPEFARKSGAGLVVAPGDVHALARGISQLFSDPSLYTRLSGAGLAYVNDRAGQAKSLARLVELCTQPV